MRVSKETKTNNGRLGKVGSTRNTIVMLSIRKMLAQVAKARGTRKRVKMKKEGQAEDLLRKSEAEVEAEASTPGKMKTPYRTLTKKKLTLPLIMLALSLSKQMKDPLMAQRKKGFSIRARKRTPTNTRLASGLRKTSKSKLKASIERKQGKRRPNNQLVTREVLRIRRFLRKRTKATYLPNLRMLMMMMTNKPKFD